MRVYVFRPAFNDQAFRRDEPLVRVDGKVIGRFKQGSFADIQLDAGHHQFSVEPSSSDSPMWRTSFPVKTVEGKTLYLGFWMEQRLGRRLSKEAAAPAALVSPLLAYLLDGQNEPIGLRLDPMEQDDAEPMLRECRQAGVE